MILCTFFLAVVPFILGCLVTKIYGDREKGNIYRYVIGVISLFCVFEVIMAPAIKMELSFKKAEVLFFATIIVLCLLGILICRKEFIGSIKNFSVYITTFSFKINTSWLMLVVLVLFVCQVLRYFTVNPFIGDDITKEIINTTLATDTMYLVHPLTGKLMEVGMTPLGKLVTLPIFYSVLTDFFQVNINHLLYVAMPVWILIISYMVMFLWGRLLFGISESRKAIRIYFLILFGAFNLFGDYHVSTVFYWISHGGWMGETIVAVVVLPLTLYFILRKRYLPILMCLGTTIFLAELGEGFWFCIIELVLAVVVQIVMKVWRACTWKN